MCDESAFSHQIDTIRSVADFILKSGARRVNPIDDRMLRQAVRAVMVENGAKPLSRTEAARKLRSVAGAIRRLRDLIGFLDEADDHVPQSVWGDVLNARDALLSDLERLAVITCHPISERVK